MKHEASEGRGGPRPGNLVGPTGPCGSAGILGLGPVRTAVACGLRAALLVGLGLGLGGCTGTRVEGVSNAELLGAICARAADLRTRISYAERRADTLRTRVKASRRLADEIRDGLRSAGVKVSSHGATFIVGIASKLLFPAGCTTLVAEATEELDRVAVVLRTRLAGRLVRVEGHTDKSKPWQTAEDFASNWELSAARAVTVARYLIESGSISPERVSIAAYGDARPISANDTKEGRAQNRRVEIVVLPPIETTRVSARIE